MTPEQLARAQELYERARALPRDDQVRFLVSACAGDSLVRSEVLRLLAHQDGDAQEENSPRASQAPASEAPTGEVPADAPNGTRETHASDTSTMSLTLGDLDTVGLHTFPGYKLIRELSHGGQGIVYEAIQQSTKRKVALKVLLPGIHASPAAQRRFEREVEIVAQLRHPCIVSIYDAGLTNDSRYFYAMDYVRGLPLHRHVRERGLTMEETLRLFLRICDALQYAHQRGVIHRDLKPSNILVDSAGNPKVLDFGLAKQLGSTADSVSRSEQIVGTLPYMAPEQTRGNPDEIDTRTDVYALGVILYELLTGKHPYPTRGLLADTLRHITHTPPERPSRAWAAGAGVSSSGTNRRPSRCPIPSDLETIVLKSLAKESARRYQSAGELARDLECLLRGAPIEAKRDSFVYVARKKLARYRMQVITAAVILVCVAAGATAAAHTRAQGREQHRQFERLREADRLSSLANALIGRRALLPQAQSQLDEALRLVPSHEQAHRLRGIVKALLGLEAPLDEKPVWLNAAVADFADAHRAAGGTFPPDSVQDSGVRQSGHGSRSALLSAANLLLQAGRRDDALPYLRLASALTNGSGAAAGDDSPPVYELHRDELIRPAATIAISPLAARAEPNNRAVVRWALHTPVRSLDPRTPEGQALAFRDLLFDRLYRVELVEAGELAALPNPAMIQGDVQLSADGLTREFDLRADLRWHDGKPLTADDIVYSWRAQGIEESGLASVESLSATRIRVVHAAPSPRAEWDLLFQLLPGHLLRDPAGDGARRFAAEPVGNGPYRWSPTSYDNVIILERWADYVGPAPHLARIEFHVLPNREERLEALAAGRIDVVGLSGEEFRWLVNGASFRRHARKVIQPRWAFDYIGWNNSAAPFDDARVRRALTLAMNLDRVISQRFGDLYTPCTGIYHQQAWMANTRTARLPHDPVEAGRLLSAAGWDLAPNQGGIRQRDGRAFTFELLVPDVSLDVQSLAYDLQQDLRSIGVEMRVVALPWAECLRRVQAGEYDAYAMQLRTSPYPTEDWIRWTTGAELNYVRYSNPRVDLLFKLVREEFDRVRQRELFQEIQAHIYEDQPCAFLWNVPTLVAVSHRLRGVQITPLGLTGSYPGPRAWWVPVEVDGGQLACEPADDRLIMTAAAGAEAGAGARSRP